MHILPGYLFHCTLLKIRQREYYKYLTTSGRVSVYLIVGSGGGRFFFCLSSLFTHMCGIQFLFQLSEIFRTCNMWIQMTNSNNSNFSCFFVSLILVGSQTLATCHPTSFLSIPGIIWSDNTRLLSMFYFPLFTQSHFIWLWLCSPDITAFTKFCPTFYSSWTIGAWEMLRLHGVLLWSGKIRFTPLSM